LPNKSAKFNLQVKKLRLERMRLEIQAQLQNQVSQNLFTTPRSDESLYSNDSSDLATPNSWTDLHLAPDGEIGGPQADGDMYSIVEDKNEVIAMLKI
jgi:hypothetical protein